MKKNDKVILALYIVLGIALMIISVRMNIDYYSTLIFAMGCALTFSSMMQFLRFYYNTRPKNVDAYREKLHHQNIELRDERKVQIRSRSGYITWAITMVCCFIASFVAALFRVGNMIVVLLWVIGMAEYLVALIVYKYLDKKM